MLFLQNEINTFLTSNLNFVVHNLQVVFNFKLIFFKICLLLISLITSWNFAAWYFVSERIINDPNFYLIPWQTWPLSATLFQQVKMFTNFTDSLGDYFIAYCFNNFLKYPRNFIPPRIYIATLMYRCKVLQEDLFVLTNFY